MSLAAADIAPDTKAMHGLLPLWVGFTVYALAAPSLSIEGPLTGPSARAALAAAGVLGEAKITGLYTLNPRLAND